MTPEAINHILQRKMKQTEYAAAYKVSRSVISNIQCGVSHRAMAEETTRFEDEEIGNVLVIGDLHEPFCLPDYLQFNVDLYNRFDCETVVFIGDVIDNHYSSYHETDPDGMSGGDELGLAIEKLKPWVDTFPDAHVTIGNHDRMTMRKAFTGGIPRIWIKEYKDVLGAPGWKFIDEVMLDGVIYIHGEGGSAKTRALKEQCSMVQGHLHSQAYVEQIVGRRTRVFGMQVGCGIDRRAYAMAYGKTGPKPAIGSAVVLDGGTLPVQVMMELGS
jgi:hypothetical protein